MTSDEIDRKIAELEQGVERLRALYEQYFLGIEKQEPLVARKAVDRRIDELRRMRFNNTARRFRLQTTISRYNTFAQYWMRILREIDNGTYRRHRLRAEKRWKTTDDVNGKNGKVAAEAGASPPSVNGANSDALPPSAEEIEPISSDPPTMRREALAAMAPPEAASGAKPNGAPRRPPPPPGAGETKKRPPPPKPSAPSAAKPYDAEKIYREVLAQRQKLNEPGAITMGELEKTLSQTTAKLKEKHPGRRIDFRVVVQGGKARVRPVIK